MPGSDSAADGMQIPFLSMSKTRIFVSSTCYDLSAVREDLRAHLTAVGHDPLLSEYPSFPIDPDDTTIGNCKRNVQHNTDIFVLIVGGHRGSLDKATGKSVTNIEYDAARQLGIPCFVFVRNAVLTLLPVWQKNAAADFSPTVDNPDVFNFVTRIRAENHWTFPFEKTADIKEILTLQLSGMLRQLLKRSRAGILDPLASYASESSEAQLIAREKPEYWEFLLTAELLKTKFIEVRRRYERLKAGSAYIPSRLVAGRDFFPWVQAKLADILSLVDAIKVHLPAFNRAWGKPGQPGDVHEIQRTAAELGALCEQLIIWEEDLRSATPPEKARPLKQTMEGFTEGILQELETLAPRLLQLFEGGKRPTGEINIMLTINSPPLDRFEQEARRLEQQPLDWIW
jgi:hypothetical protein